MRSSSAYDSEKGRYGVLLISTAQPKGCNLMPVDPKLVEAAEKCKEKKLKAKKTVDGEAPEKSKGQKLDSNTRKAMEEAFGEKLGNVQVYSDKEAQEACKQLGAKAFAVGEDIYFSSSSSAKDNELVAHALSHVVQQKGKTKKGKVDVIK